jgi:hypothetical protein
MRTAKSPEQLIKHTIALHRRASTAVPIHERNPVHTAIVYLIDKEGRFVLPFSLKHSTEAAAPDRRSYV